MSFNPINYPRPFKRLAAFPLDIDSKFDTIEQMNAYLSNNVRYAGQMVTCLQTPGQIYILSNDRSEWLSSTVEQIPKATQSQLGGVIIGNGIDVDQAGKISVDLSQIEILPATEQTIGGVIIGDGIDVNQTGKISVDPYQLPVATQSQLGGVRIGNGIDVDENGLISVDASGIQIQLPKATQSQLGGVIIGNGIDVDQDGKISVELEHDHDDLYQPKNENIQQHINDGQMHVDQEMASDIQQLKVFVDNLPIANQTQIGMVIVGNGLLIDQVGNLSVDAEQVMAAGHNHDDLYQPKNDNIQQHIGDTSKHLSPQLLQDMDTAYDHSQQPHAPANANFYQLPIADQFTLGGIKVGQYLHVDESGTLKIIPQQIVAGNHDHDEDYQPKNENIQQHISNDQIHVTLQDKTDWNDNKINTDQHISDEGLHFLQGQKQDILTSILVSDIHVDDTQIHVTQTDKINWNNKVDKVAGKGLSTQDYTTQQKGKLAGLDNSKYKGIYTSVAALQNANVQQAGAYAYVDLGIPDGIRLFIYDYSNAQQWVQQVGEHGIQTPASIKDKYQQNQNTEAFTTQLKNKLNSIAIQDLHTHGNKVLIDGITTTNLNNWNDAYSHSQQPHAPSGAKVHTAGSGISISDTGVIVNTDKGSDIDLSVKADLVHNHNGQTLVGRSQKVQHNGQVFGSLILNCSQANVFTFQPTGDVNISLSNAKAGQATGVTLQILRGGSHHIYWDSNITFGEVGAPPLTDTYIDVVSFFTIDGVFWKGIHVMTYEQ